LLEEEPMQDITNQERPETSRPKRKTRATTSKHFKKRKIEDDTENITEEQKMAFRECGIQIQVQVQVQVQEAAA